MNEDIVFPDGNEEEFIEIAEKLSFQVLHLAYSFRSDFKKISDDIDRLSKGTVLKLRPAVFLDTQNTKALQLAKEKLKKSGLIIFKASNADLNRFVIESIRPDIMFGFEEAEKKDFIHQRGGSINQILCKLMKSNSTSIGISFRSLLESRGMLRAQIYGRMLQNMRLADKYKVKYQIYSFADKPFMMRTAHDLSAFLRL